MSCASLFCVLLRFRLTATVWTTALLLLLIPVPLVSLEISESNGQAEILVTDLGWRRAVIGRPVIANSRLTTWNASNVVVQGETLRFRLDPISVATITEVAPELSITLNAGRIHFNGAPGGGSSVTVQADSFSVRSFEAAFTLTRRSVVVVEGSVEVTDPSGHVFILDAPGEYSFILHSP